MLLQQPINNDFSQAQQQPQQQQQGPGRPAQQSQSGVIRQLSGHPKPVCGAHSSSPHSLLRENSSPSTQVHHCAREKSKLETRNTSSLSSFIETSFELTVALKCLCFCRSSRGFPRVGRLSQWVCQCRQTRVWRCPSTATPWCSLRPTRGLSKMQTKDTQTTSSAKRDNYGKSPEKHS